MARKTTITGGAVRDDSLTGDDIDESTLVLNQVRDADGDTKIQVEESSDEDKIRFDTAGSERMVIDATGKVGIGIASPTSPLHVYGNLDGTYVATIDNDQNSNAHVLKLLTDGNGSGSRLLEMEDGDGDIIFRARADGRFGFGPDGVDSMGAGTFVVGIDNSSHTSDIAISKRLQHLGDSDTYLDFPANDQMILTAGNMEMIRMVENGSSSEITFNDGASADLDFVIKGDTNNPLFHTDAANNRIGIGGVGSPTQTLEVGGDIGINEKLVHNGDTDTYLAFSGQNTMNLVANGYSFLKYDGAIKINNANRDRDTQIMADDGAVVLHVDAGTNRVGIGATDPATTLAVVGSISAGVTIINSNNDPGTTYTVADADYAVLVNTRPTDQGGIDSALTITLPLAASYPGRILIIKDDAGYANTNNIIISRAGSDTIEGVATTLTLNSVAQFTRLISNGSTNWSEIGKG